MARPYRFIPFALLFAVPPAASFERAPMPSEAPLEACPAQGPGFGRIPGTTTCIRLSGRVAVEADTGTRAHSSATPPTRGRISVDTRSDTDAGPLRSFTRIDAGRR